MPTAALERLRILYDAGRLTRGDLYDRITKLGASPDAAARVFSDPTLLQGLAEWQRSVAGGAHAFGGEWSDADAYRVHPVDPDEFSSDEECDRELP